MADSWHVPILSTNFFTAKLFSVIAYCFEAALSVGAHATWIWIGTIGVATLGWLMMQTWVRAWNLQWNGTLPTSACLICAVTFALAAFAIFGAINLENFLVGEVEQTGEKLCHASNWGIESFQKSLFALGLPVMGKEVKLRSADQLESMYQATNAQVRQAFATRFPGLLTGTSAVPVAKAPVPETDGGFSINLDSYIHWAEEAIDRQVQADVTQVRAFAQRVTNLVIRAVATACLLFNGLLALGAACYAYADIFRPSYRTIALRSIS